MKIRKFYPSQVIRRQSGKQLSLLDAANSHALQIALRRSRKMGCVITVVGDLVDVRGAEEVGRMILGDIRAAVQKTHFLGTATPSVVIESLPRVSGGS